VNEAEPYLRGIGQLADKLTKEFAVLPYEKFVEDAEKIESAVVRIAIMKEAWTWLPGEIQEELIPIDWCIVPGTWDWEARRHVGIDSKQLYETIVWRLPEVSRRIGGLLKRTEMKKAG
jgi:uncharacterized protein with HEPN domain